MTSLRVLVTAARFWALEIKEELEALLLLVDSKTGPYCRLFDLSGRSVDAVLYLDSNVRQLGLVKLVSAVRRLVAVRLIDGYEQIPSSLIADALRCGVTDPELAKQFCPSATVMRYLLG